MTTSALSNHSDTEIALQMTDKYFYKYNAIDFGCADGVFLLSLSKYFNKVVGIDILQGFIKTCKKIIKDLNLENVDVICNENTPITKLKASLLEKKFKVVFMLETIEHIGDKNSIWDSKIEFLKDVFTLVEENGVIVLSAPVMTGIP